MKGIGLVGCSGVPNEVAGVVAASNNGPLLVVSIEMTVSQILQPIVILFGSCVVVCFGIVVSAILPAWVGRVGGVG